MAEGGGWSGQRRSSMLVLDSNGTTPMGSSTVVWVNGKLNDRSSSLDLT